MKKLLCVLICAVMLMCSSALAAGLPQISGGTLPAINGGGTTGVLPDPADLLGREGEIFERNYEYGVGYTCTVYLYPQPADTSAFLTAYQQSAEANGFKVDFGQSSGEEAMQLTCGGKTALLFPNYSGTTMLMVENGMTFGEALPEGCYAQVTRNGRKMATNDPGCNKSSYPFDAYEMVFCFDEAPISYMNLDFPDYAQEGDYFHLTRDDLEDGLIFYTEEEEFLIYRDYEYDNRLESLADYFTLEITKMEKTNTHVYIEGTFEGSFDAGEILYEDGSFRVEMLR